MGLARIFFVVEHFSKILKEFLKKIAKNALFYHIFKKANKPCANFSRVWTKNANCWEVLKIFDANDTENLHFHFGKFVTKSSLLK